MTYYRSPWCGALYWSQCHANSCAATTRNPYPRFTGTALLNKTKVKLALFVQKAKMDLALFVQFLFSSQGGPPVGLVPPAGGVPTVGNSRVGPRVGGRPTGGLVPAVGTELRGGLPPTVGREQNVGQTPWSAADPLVGRPTHLQIYPVGPSPTVGPMPAGRPQTRGAILQS